MTTETTSRKSREFDKLPWDTFQSMLDKLPDIAQGQLAEALGYSSATVLRQWEAAGFAPKVACLALECMVRRQNPRNAELHPKMLLLKFRDKDSFALFELMADKVKGMEVLYSSPEKNGA